MVGSDRALVRVLSNLVANAIAHTPSGGTVELAFGTDEHSAWARVDDTGVGIDEADLPRVFDVAYRGSNSRVPRSDRSLPSGSGLGLAIAAGLVQAHHGTLTAHNLPTGARFEVRLPLAYWFPRNSIPGANHAPTTARNAIPADQPGSELLRRSAAAT